jgi:hypothetical protein
MAGEAAVVVDLTLALVVMVVAEAEEGILLTRG